MQGYLYEKKNGLSFINSYKKYWFSLENNCLLKFRNINFELVERIE